MTLDCSKPIIMKEFYDEELLNRYIKAQLTSVERHILLDKKLISIEDKILDVGSGPGRVSLYLSGFAKEIIGIDISEESIKFCNKKANELNISNVKCLYGDISDKNILFLLSEYQPFDKALLMYNTIEGIPGKSNRIKALENINSLLNERGKLILSIHNKFWVKWLRNLTFLNIKRVLLKLRLMRKLTALDECLATSEFNSILIVRPHTIYPWYFYSLYELKNDLEKAGFSIERIFLTEDDNPLDPRNYKVIDEIDYKYGLINKAKLVLKMLNVPKYYIIASKN